jgi:ketosteroid isomerase-like protein
MKRYWTLAVLLAAMPLGCRSSTPGPSSSADAVAREAESYLLALQSNNIDSIATHWTDSIVVMPPNEPILRGRAALQTYLEGFLQQMRFVEGQFTESSVIVSGDLATQRVAFTLTVQSVAGGTPVTNVGKGLHVFRRQPDGQWKLAMDIWNADAPAAP